MSTSVKVALQNLGTLGGDLNSTLADVEHPSLRAIRDALAKVEPVYYQPVAFQQSFGVGYQPAFQQGTLAGYSISTTLLEDIKKCLNALSLVLEGNLSSIGLDYAIGTVLRTILSRKSADESDIHFIVKILSDYVEKLSKPSSVDSAIYQLLRKPTQYRATVATLLTIAQTTPREREYDTYFWELVDGVNFSEYNDARPSDIIGKTLLNELIKQLAEYHPESPWDYILEQLLLGDERTNKYCFFGAWSAADIITTARFLSELNWGSYAKSGVSLNVNLAGEFKSLPTEWNEMQELIAAYYANMSGESQTESTPVSSSVPEVKPEEPTPAKPKGRGGRPRKSPTPPESN